MDQQTPSSLGLLLIIATLVMFIMSLSIIMFAVLYQQKMRRKKQEMIQLELNYKNEMVQATLEAKEIEQRRIAIELHDDIGSSLTALKLSFASLPIGEEDRKLLNEGVQITIGKVRSLSNRLLPSILEELGLVPAVKSLINTLAQQIHYIRFSIIAVNDPKHESQTREVSLAVYRILQELVNNILKYAEATSIQITLEQNEGGIRLIIIDDGNGFVPTKEDKLKSQSLGLKNIESRSQQIDAKIEYQLMDPGTKVILVWEPKEQV
ncbi:MAG: histidine kinase [Fluviicola sp.]|jgi:signal transduction histidine kinase|uniref:sensor histidine kinase n=1 Tax=Fluviicola sp. TaxID=1917219 RepID=UPI002621D6E9|nr:ATP-binding protein [Fluviicola sp.]MDF3028467.1 histidine kinase [Fluviicola sp.]